MTIILRLQGLDEKAGIDDIRSFFKALHIPDGGVYIVGGRLCEAFIAFSTEREAQLAMRRSGEAIKGFKVTLNISSVAQLEQRLEPLIKRRTSWHTAIKPQPRASSRHEENAAKFPPSASFPPETDTANVSRLNDQPPSANTSERSLNSNMAFLLGISTALQGLQSTQTPMPVIDVDTNESTDDLSVEEATPEQTVSSKLTQSPSTASVAGEQVSSGPPRQTGVEQGLPRQSLCWNRCCSHVRLKRRPRRCRASDICYLCGGVGHWAFQCPNKE